MQTKLVSSSKISNAVSLLKAGEPVVFPTETVYGLGAPIDHEKALLKIFSIKMRPSDNPLIVHVASIEEALALCSTVPALFWTLSNRFWPGPLTLVLNRNEKILPIISAGHATIAIRMPSHQLALSLIREVGRPIAAPSANLSGRPSPTCALHAWEDLKGRVALILDGGECSLGIESTVVSLISPNPILLRPGCISAEEIEETIRMKLDLPLDAPIHSPGMKYRHYAPQTPVKLVFSRKDLNGPFILSLNPQKGERLLTEKNLYAQFREADRIGAYLIEIDCSPPLLANAALINRIFKAAEKEP